MSKYVRRESKNPKHKNAPGYQKVCRTINKVRQHARCRWLKKRRTRHVNTASSSSNTSSSAVSSQGVTTRRSARLAAK